MSAPQGPERYIPSTYAEWAADIQALAGDKPRAIRGRALDPLWAVNVRTPAPTHERSLRQMIGHWAAVRFTGSFAAGFAVRARQDILPWSWSRTYHINSVPSGYDDIATGDDVAVWISDTRPRFRAGQLVRVLVEPVAESTRVKVGDYRPAEIEDQYEFLQLLESAASSLVKKGDLNPPANLPY